MTAFMCCYLDFPSPYFRKQYRDLETNHHHHKTTDISRCWTQPPASKHLQSAASPHVIPGITKESCVDWNDEYRAEPDNWGNLKLCTCHGKFLGGQKNQDKLILKSELQKHNCAICTIASDLGTNKYSNSLHDVVATRCEETPIYDVSDLKDLPEVNKDTVRNVQQRFNKIHTRDEKGEGENEKGNIVPFPSGYNGNRVSSGQNSGKISQTYPYCGTPINNVCECIDGNKEKDRHPMRKEPSHISYHIENEIDTKGNACGCKTKKNVRDRPKISLKDSTYSKNVQFDGSRNSQAVQHGHEQISTHRKEYQFPVIPRTGADDLQHQKRRFNPKYWASDDSDNSTFSDPPPICENICEQCNGVTNCVPQRQHDSNQPKIISEINDGQAEIQRVHYLSPMGEVHRKTGVILSYVECHDLVYSRVRTRRPDFCPRIFHPLKLARS